MTTAALSFSSPAWAAEYELCERRCAGHVSAYRFWEGTLTAADRASLGNDFEIAYEKHHSAVGMWMHLKNVSRQRAVVDVARQLGHLFEQYAPRLLKEIGEDLDVASAIASGIAAGDLVLIDDSRAVYWEGEEIDIDWYKYSVLWEFFWKLSCRSKAGKYIDAMNFFDGAGRDVVIKRKSRLIKIKAFPVELGDLIERAGTGQQRLNLPANRIRIFETDFHGNQHEWYP